MLGLLAHGFHLLLLVLGLVGVVAAPVPPGAGGRRSSRRTTFRAPAESPRARAARRRAARLRRRAVGSPPTPGRTTAPSSPSTATGLLASGAALAVGQQRGRRGRARRRVSRTTSTRPSCVGVFFLVGHARPGGLGRAWSRLDATSAACSSRASPGASAWSRSGPSPARVGSPSGSDVSPSAAGTSPAGVWELVVVAPALVGLRQRRHSPSAGHGRPRAPWPGPGWRSRRLALLILTLTVSPRLTDRRRRTAVWWMLGAVCNAVISIAYFMIAFAIVRPLVTSRQLSDQRARGGHRRHLPDLRGAPRRPLRAHADALRRRRPGAGHWRCARPGDPSWRSGTSSAPWSRLLLDPARRLRRRQREPQLFKDQVEREQRALELNDAVLQGMVVARMALDLGERKRAMEALDSSISAASRMITELIGDDRGQLANRPLRSSPALVDGPRPMTRRTGGRRDERSSSRQPRPAGGPRRRRHPGPA